jgi:UDP-N-acetyl-D-mannosaminuronic acid dehydrogenase
VCGEMTTICILGLGYIGLPTASLFASNNYRVIGVDTNEQIIASLNSGKLHIQEPGLAEIVQKALSSGNLVIKSKPDLADAFVIAVPTPFNSDKTADMRAVISAANAIVPYLRQNNLVVLESTSPPRTTINLVKTILEKSGLKAGVDFFLAYSPERVLPGQIIAELVKNDRVIGGINQSSAEAGAALYRAFVKGNIVLTDATTAEMVKLMENTYRDVSIALANEFSRLADRFGVDVWEAIQIANRHPRVSILQPGPGVGGHCISVDPWFLVEAAPDLAQLIRIARQVNDDQPHFVVERVQKMVGNLNGKRIAALGMTYKANVDDLRESPSIEIIHLLQEHGAIVQAFDPFRPDAIIPDIDAKTSLADVLRDADVILLLVGHQQFRELNPFQVSGLTHARLILDTVNVWPREEWERAGFQMAKLGAEKRNGRSV